MKKFYTVLLLALLCAAALLAQSPVLSDCETPGCQHFIPTRTPTPPPSPLQPPEYGAARYVVYIPFVEVLE